MNAHAKRFAIVEERFLSGVEANLGRSGGSVVGGSARRWTTLSQEETVRQLMSDARLYDRDVLRRMPKNTTRILTGTRRRLLFWEKRTGVAMASVLSPLAYCLGDKGEPPPIGLPELVAHVKDLVGQAKVPHVVGVCSPCGFTDEAKAGGVKLANVSLVLIEPRAEGGWRVLAGSSGVSAETCRLFDPEEMSHKFERVRRQVRTERVALLTGGLSASAIADKLGLTEAVVASAFERMAGDEPELRVTRQRTDVLLFRGASADMEDSEMSAMDRLLQILGRTGNETKKINVLSERRARLVQRRDRLHADLGELEKREAELLAEGRQSASKSVKQRAAVRIKQLRSEMDRLNATARMVGQQVDVISTHIHNLTLIQQGQTVELPTSEEITKDAVRAEEMLEQLGAEVGLADSLSTGVSQSTMTDEELAIMRELEGEPAGGEAPTSAESAGPAAAPAEPEPDRREPEAS